MSGRPGRISRASTRERDRNAALPGFAENLRGQHAFSRPEWDRAGSAAWSSRLMRFLINFRPDGGLRRVERKRGCRSTLRKSRPGRADDGHDNPAGSAGGIFRYLDSIGHLAWRSLIAVPLLSLIIPIANCCSSCRSPVDHNRCRVVIQDWRKIHVRSTGWLIAATFLGYSLGISLLTSITSRPSKLYWLLYCSVFRILSPGQETA